MKKSLIILAVASSFSLAQASITLQLTFGAIYDSTGADIGVGKVGVVVLSTDGIFPTATDLQNKTIALGQSWSANDTVIGIIGATNQTVTGDVKSPANQFNSTFTVDFNALGIPVAPAGTKFGLYWFPAITDSDLVTAGVQFAPGGNVIAPGSSYGFYRSDSIANLGITGINSPTANSAFVTPADGSTQKTISRNIDALTSTQEGQMGTNFAPSVSDYTASLTVTPVPEPSTYAAIFALSVFGLAVYRRKNA